MVLVSCECGRQLRARDSDAGRRAACPRCKKKTRVPAKTSPVCPPGRDIVEQCNRERNTRRRAEQQEHEAEPLEVAWQQNKLASRSCLLGGLSLLALGPAIVVPAGIGETAALGVILLGAFGIAAGVQALLDIVRCRDRLGGIGLALAGLGLAVLALAGLVLGVYADCVGRKAW
jgi:hypothetical protein